ncbi:non-ribosomal peptide synthetase [Emticicia fluvialis]|uniref:non-ribosomal peptide synthetase n=1 Tax=Emticicia fluvialis TaxID=2974474 RepID=UPI002165D7C3|nr:non-ribosomal peptide synthetase [Emticicia fluvialis]
MSLDFQGPEDVQFRKFEQTWLDLPVFKIFEEVVRRNPDKIALQSDAAQLSYRATYQLACTLAGVIKGQSTQKEPIGIALPNDVFFPVAMLAALAAGCGYVPLDIDLPEARNRLIIEQSGVKSVITLAELADSYRAFHPICMDALTAKTEETFVCTAKAEDLAYIIYTSGSTGVPKGVYQNQRNLLHDVMQYTNSVHLNENDRLTLLYSPSVNGAIRDIYGALLNGTTLIIKNLKKGGLYDLSQFIRQEGITVYHSIPNIFRTFLKLNPAQDDLSSVRLIYLAGDRIYNADVALYKSFFGADCLLYVGIGATEIATIYRQWFINHQTVIGQELIPLGYSVEDRKMLLVGEGNTPVPDGEPGEITVSSPYISLGYWKNADQTRTSFSTDPTHPEIRTYRTGDLGRINQDGLLEFIGRKDNQVKINGYRVELSEIEGALMKHPAIDRCGVIVHTQSQHNALFAFFISKTILAEPILKEWLAEQLPAYMIPQRCIQVNDLPTLHNFKNDSKALKALAEKYATQASETDASGTNEDFLYQTLKQTWCKILDKKSFDNDVSWKNAGGDSVNAVNFLVQLESDLNTNLPTDWIHGAMTPGEIYGILKAMDIQIKDKSVYRIYVFPAVIGITESTRVFLNNLSEHVSINIISYPDFSLLAARDRNWDYAIKKIFEQMPDYNQPNVGYLGICTGGLLMNKIITARQLQNYLYLGVVEGLPKMNTVFPKDSFFKRTKDFLERGDFIQYGLRMVYVRSALARKLVYGLEERLNIKIFIPSLLWYHYYQLEASPIDAPLWYYGCDGSYYDPSGSPWKPYFSEIHTISLIGGHLDMLDEHNAPVVIKHLVETIYKTSPKIEQAH